MSATTEAELHTAIKRFQQSLRENINPKNLNKFIQAFMEYIFLKSAAIFIFYNELISCLHPTEKDCLIFSLFLGAQTSQTPLDKSSRCSYPLLHPSHN